MCFLHMLLYLKKLLTSDSGGAAANNTKLGTRKKYGPQHRQNPYFGESNGKMQKTENSAQHNQMKIRSGVGGVGVGYNDW